MYQKPGSVLELMPDSELRGKGGGGQQILTVHGSAEEHVHCSANKGAAPQCHRCGFGRWLQCHFWCTFLMTSGRSPGPGPGSLW